ncbi:unnamed protein product [Prorocentrum cordatum]|uniref:Thioredoxin domain-containing protein n=1 Tax=Prorocentrum cordatum TaxID=2364126 RepID=A0ABN9VYP3_9DINO|nr:unnamed protein product [Polarella glacialis]
MAAFTEMLGHSLLGPGGEVTETAAALSGKGAIALYFSAHWCPPCRGFTPQLAEWYRKDLQAKGLEVVFVSSDRDEAAFKEYFADQPWMALPFVERDAKEKLSKMYKVNGIPSLVILDSDGKIITTEGRVAVSEDPTGAEFPWRPRPVKELLAEAKLVGPAGELTVQQAMQEKKALALYFSAHWCPPCRGFTPKLAEWYRKDLQAKGLEVVFVSSDRDEAAFKEYFASQPWMALSYADRNLQKKLNKALKVEGIPTLVILDADLNVVTTDGRGAVAADPTGAEMPWYPKPVKQLKDGPGDINEVPTLLIFCESSDAAGVDALTQALEPLAAKYIEQAKATGQDPDFCFMLAAEGADLAPRVRGMVGLPETPSAGAVPRMALIDIPDQGGYYLAAEGSEVTAASVERFLADYKAGALERKQLK